MDLEEDGLDKSSEVSDADPAEILNKIKDIDDLDAELFSSKRKLTPPKLAIKQEKFAKEKKKVSFQDPSELSKDSTNSSNKSKPKYKASADEFDFDVNDPLADLLSDEDDLLSPSLGSGAPKSGKKEAAADDWLFAEDDADDLLDDGAGRAKEKTKIKDESKKKFTVDSLMRRDGAEGALKASSPSVKKMTLDDFASKAAKMGPESKASPYTAGLSSSTQSRQIKFDDEFGFGSYQPSLSSPADTKRKTRSRMPQSGNSDFFDFLKEDDNGFKQEQDSSPVAKPASVRARPATASDVPSVSLSETSNSELRPRTAEPIKSSALYPAPEKQQVVYDTPVLTSVQDKPSSLDITLASPLPKTPPVRKSRRTAESPLLASQTPFPETLEIPRVTPARVPQLVKDSRPIVPQTYSSSGEESRSQGLEVQLAHARALLHNVELGYKADLEVTEATYNSRIELLRSSFDDLKSRVDRELESVRESYSARITVLRNAMQSQVLADTSKECEHQEEIKRLRNLHLQALDECRQDGDSQITRLKEAHVAEVDAVKNSTYHARNIESMMLKVEESTSNLQQLSSKYESAYRAMTQQSETIALSNRQLISVVQNQLGQQQRSTSDAQVQMQQTASRLEGAVSEMNRKMEEQHYAMQLSHSNLQSAHVALQEERKQFMQQITLEREHMRKAHREMVTIQNEIRQEAREDHSKLVRASDELAAVATRFEETRITEAEQAQRRKREHDEAVNILNSDKMDLAKKRAHLEAATEKLTTRREDLNNKLMQFNEEKQTLDQIQHVLEQKEANMNALAQKAIDTEADKERVFAEAKRIEDDQSKKLAEIHSEMKELTKQRQLLAEERKALAQERNSGELVLAGSPDIRSVVPAFGAGSAATPVRRGPVIGHPGSPEQTTSAGLVLWRHSAKKDQSFLEDEQFFLETLRNSPYGKRS